MDETRSFFQWKDAFSVGIDEIDEQHRSFLELLNGCYESVAENSEDVVSKELVQELKEYITVHFSYEEKLLEYVAYPGLAQQRAQHQYFQTLVADLDPVQHEGNPVKLKSTLSILRDWFLHHVLEEDMKYVPYLKHAK